MDLNDIPPTVSGFSFSAPEITYGTAPTRGSALVVVGNSISKKVCFDDSSFIAWKGYRERAKIQNWDLNSITSLTKNNKTIKLVDIPANEVGPYDVLYVGRGGFDRLKKKREYSGYIWYRSMIDLIRPGYLMCTGKTEKMKLSRWIVDKVRECGGRFMKKDKKTRLYQDVGDSVAQGRTSMALRDRRLLKTSLQTYTNDLDYNEKYGFVKNVKLADVFRECEIYSFQLEPPHPSPFVNERLQSTHASKMMRPIPPSTSVGSMVRVASPYMNSRSEQLPVTPASFVSIPTVMNSTPLRVGPGPVDLPTRLTSSTFGASSLVHQSHRLTMEKQMLQQEILRDREIIVRRQERLAHLESEQQRLIFQQECMIQGEQLHRCMTERELIRLKIREEMRIQEEMDAQVMRREMHKRAMWQSSVYERLHAPARHQWEMRQHPVIPLVSPAPSIVVNQSYGRTTEQRLLREQARKANGFEERKKKIFEGREVEDCIYIDSDEESEDDDDIII
jgi:hypothetical protein